MIIYNSKEYESKYTATDDFVFEIHSQYTLEDLLDKLRNGQDITPEDANIVAYSGKENGGFQTDAAKENERGLWTAGYSIVSDPDDIEDLQTEYTEKLRKRADILQAFEKFSFNQPTPEYTFHSIPFSQAMLKDQLYACLGILPTLKEASDKTIPELKKMSSDGNRLFYQFIPVSSENKLPRREDIEFYQSLNDYEKKVIADSDAHPMRLLDLAKEIKKNDKDRIFTEADTTLAERHDVYPVSIMANISRIPGIKRKDRLYHDRDENTYCYGVLFDWELDSDVDLKTASIIQWAMEEFDKTESHPDIKFVKKLLEETTFSGINQDFAETMFSERVIPEEILRNHINNRQNSNILFIRELTAYYNELQNSFHHVTGKNYHEELVDFAKKHYKAPMTNTLHKAEEIFKELYHGHAPRVLAEYMYAQFAAKGIDPNNATDTQLREIAEKFDQKNIQIIAKYKNYALFAMADKLKFGEMRTDHIQVIATYADRINIKKLIDKGFPEWYMAHKDTNTSDLVQLFENQHKISRYDMDLTARQIIVRENNKKGMEDCEKFERDYHIRFSDNELAIRGRNIIAESGNMKMYMLPKDDYRNFTVGYDTNCCQHYGNAGESCVYKAVTDPFAGTVVIEKNHKILAQAFVWTDEAKDTFVFDNMEFANDGQVASYMSLIAGYCEAMPYKNIHMGMGYNTLGNGIGKPINPNEEAKLPTTIAQNPRHNSWAGDGKDVYSDYHVASGGNKARVLKRDGRTFVSKTSCVHIIAGVDEPTRWDLLARPETAFMLNDYRSPIEERLRFATMLHGNPDLRTQMEAVRRDPHLIRIIENPLPEVQTFAVNQDRSVAHLINNPCDEVQMILIGDDPDYIRHVKAPSESICINILRKNGLLLEEIMKKVRAGDIPMPNARIFETAVTQNGYAIRQVPPEFQTETLQELAVTSNPKVISLMVNPSIEIQQKAIEANPNVIALIEDPSPEIQIYTVNVNPALINDIPNPCYDAIKLAVQRNGLLIRNFQTKYPELRAIAIRQNPFIVTNGTLKNVQDEEYLQAARINRMAISKLMRSAPELYGNIQYALAHPNSNDRETEELLEID